METRKLQEVGGGTYTVSIPKEWADRHALEAGEPVGLYPHGDGSIVVQSGTDTDALPEARIELDGTDPTPARRLLRTAHAAGFETVTLDPTPPFSNETRRAIRDCARGLVGVEIVDAGDGGITVRCPLDASTVSVDRTLVQLQSIALATHRNGTAVLTDDGIPERVRERYAETRRLSGMLARHFSRSLHSLAELDHLGVDHAGLFDYCETARYLEQVADQGVALARLGEGIDAPPEVIGELGRAAETTRHLADDATTAVLGADVDTARGVLEEYSRTVADIEGSERALVEDVTGDRPVRTAVGVARSLDRLTRTADCAAAIADVAVRAGTRDRDT